MKFRLSTFADAFLGSGVPLAGDPITSFQNVPLLGLRTGTLLNNSNPTARDVLKVGLMATNCGDKRLEIIPFVQAIGEGDPGHSGDKVLTLHPGESMTYSVFRSWDAPGEYQLTLAYAARRPGQPFARLAYPKVVLHVIASHSNAFVYWLSSLRTALTQSVPSQGRRPAM